MNVKEFIETVLILEIGEMRKSFRYHTFGCISSGIDFIYAICTFLNINIKNLSVKKLRYKGYKGKFVFGYDYFDEKFKNLYSEDLIWCIRCSMLHGWVIKGLVLTHSDCVKHTKNLLELNYFYDEYVKALKKFMNELTQSELNTEILSIK